MTLEELYADWECKMLTRPIYARKDISTHARWYDIDMGKGLLIHPSELAAKLYCIARDEGISAAVMWKLANGGAQ